jgi:hypothetical protein
MHRLRVRSLLRHGRLLGLVVALLALAAGPGTAARPAFNYDSQLREAIKEGLLASTFENEHPVIKPVYIKCYRDARAFERPLIVNFRITPEEAKLVYAYRTW